MTPTERVMVQASLTMSRMLKRLEPMTALALLGVLMSATLNRVGEADRQKVAEGWIETLREGIADGAPHDDDDHGGTPHDD